MLVNYRFLYYIVNWVFGAGWLCYSSHFATLFLHYLIYVDANGGSGFAHYVSKCVQLQTHRQKILHWFYTAVLWYVHTTTVAV